ncbi:MAG TPA: S49 family peptidase [Pyrinomonadaceae bacterium]
MKHRLFDFYASKSWAILPESLQEMYDIYRTAIDRKALDIDFDPEAVSAKTGVRLDNTRRVEIRGDGVAIIPVMGPIFGRANLFTEISGATSIEMLAKDFNEARENTRVKAIIFHINSPGGEVDGTSEFAQHVFNARSEKPIVAYASHLMCSAAYWIGSAASEIVAEETASLGSIGVVGSVSLDKDKKSVQFVASQSPNKRPDPESERGKSQIQRHIDDLADVFIDTVARNRGWTAAEVIEKGDAGNILAGRRAVASGLADRLGSLEGLIAELSDPQIRDEKINKQKMLSTSSANTDADSQTIGANEMADEKDKTPADKVKTDALPPRDADKPKVEAASEKQDTAEVDKLKADKAQAEADVKAKDVELAAERAKAEGLEKRMAAMEKKDRDTRFGIVAKDWSGDKAVHLDMLEHFATSEKDGENSARFKAYVTQQNAHTEQLRQSGLFKEIGSSSAVEGSADAEWEASAKKLQAESGGKLTIEQARDQVWAGNAELRKRYNAEIN